MDFSAYLQAHPSICFYLGIGVGIGLLIILFACLAHGCDWKEIVIVRSKESSLGFNILKQGLPIRLHQKVVVINNDRPDCKLDGTIVEINNYYVRVHLIDSTLEADFFLSFTWPHLMTARHSILLNNYKV